MQHPFLMAVTGTACCDWTTSPGHRYPDPGESSNFGGVAGEMLIDFATGACETSSFPIKQEKY